MAKIQDLQIISLRGGMNDSDPPHVLADDQVVLAENVEFFFTTLGERRLGCSEVDITNSGLDTEESIVHMAIHYPAQNAFTSLDSHLFAIGATPNVSVTVALRLADGSWSTVAPVDDFDVSDPEIFQMNSASLHDKWYIMHKSAVDRSHVFDTTMNLLRRVGLEQPSAAPTAVDTGSAGSFSGDRSYRVRYVTINADDVKVLRSEPSDELVFTPSGTNTGATVTRPALINEVETHWELEASDGDGNFYIIATLPIATTTYDDTINPASEYANPANGFELSAVEGDYLYPPSAKFVKIDQDRVIFAGSWENPELGSRVWWTPPTQAIGVGNDERVPLDKDSYIDLDWANSGELTGLSDPLNGSFYAFKWNRIYKLQRTGRDTGAYTAYLLSTQRGAIPGSIISGTDEFGRGCVYFLDPAVGPLRLSTGGIQHCQGLAGTWKRVNSGAAQICAHGVYYPDKQQIHWWVATDGEDKPNLRVLLQVSEIRSDADGTQRGWAIATGESSSAWCSCIVPETVLDEDTGTTSLTYRPYIGLPTPNFIQRMDSGHDDAGEEFVAKIVTKPYFITGLLNKWGAMNASLLAEPNEDPDVRINVKLIRDFGKETKYIVTDFQPELGESLVIKQFDHLSMSESYAIQIEFSDY